MQEGQPHRSWTCQNRPPTSEEKLTPGQCGDKCRIVPASPNITQYTAANMVKGIDANSAPNFPAHVLAD
mgnify:FL=1